MQTDNLDLSDAAKVAIGNRLRQERERLKLSQPAFGQAGGVGRGAQIKYEAGERLPDAEYLNLIAALGADVLYIITGQRNDSAATTPIELSFLRICRAFPNNSARMVGNAALRGILSEYSIQMTTRDSANDNVSIAAQTGGLYEPDSNK